MASAEEEPRVPELRGELRVESGRSSFLLAKIPAWCWVKLPGRFLLELQAQGLFPGQAGRGQGQGGAVAALPGAEISKTESWNRLGGERSPRSSWNEMGLQGAL